MARALTKTIKSENIAYVKNTDNDGTHNKGYVFGQRNIIASSTNASIITATGSTADVTAAWSITLVMPEKFTFKALGPVTTAAGGDLNTADYSTSAGPDGNTLVNIVANARDGGSSGTDAIANDEVVTVVWQAYDDSTLNATMFSVSCHSQTAGHTATIKFRHTEGGTLHTEFLHAGDSLYGPFSELEIDALSNAQATAVVKYQEH